MPSALLELRWVAVLAWASLIFALSGTPRLDTGLGTWDLILRKAAHVSAYAVLGLLLARVLPPIAAWLAGVVYAASDELHQHFVPGRHGAPLDVAIDAVGLLLGILLLRRLAQ